MARRRVKKTTQKSRQADPTVPVGALRHHPNANGGMLRNGGTNKGGTGRPPSVIRAACAGDFDRRRKVLRAIADNEKAKDADRVLAVNTLGKYGGLAVPQQIKLDTSQAEPLRIIVEHVQVAPRSVASARMLPLKSDA